jgi:hypothetical protein
MTQDHEVITSSHNIYIVCCKCGRFHEIWTPIYSIFKWSLVHNLSSIVVTFPPPPPPPPPTIVAKSSQNPLQTKPLKRSPCKTHCKFSKSSPSWWVFELRTMYFLFEKKRSNPNPILQSK